MQPRRERLPVAVILPFHGAAQDAAEATARLEGLRTAPEDELVLVDNSPVPVPRSSGGVRVVRSPVAGSAYAARNVGAEATSAPWLLFVDADCRIPPDLLDAYFRPPPAAEEGAVSGGLRGTPDQPGLVPSYVRSRRHLEQDALLRHPFRPMAVTANLLVRRSAFEAVGGFQEATRSGADADMCWRLQDAGWRLGHRPRALVLHDHRESLSGLLRQTRRDGAGARWLARRHSGYRATPGPRVFARAALGAVGWPLLGQPRRGLYKALDGLWAAAFALGALESNAPAAPEPGPPVLCAFLDLFPAQGDPVVAALAGARGPVLVLARRRPARPDWRAGRSVAARFAEDQPRLDLRRSSRRRLLAGAAPAARVVTEPELAGRAAAAVAAAGRNDLEVRLLPADRDTAAHLIAGVVAA